MSIKKKTLADWFDEIERKRYEVVKQTDRRPTIILLNQFTWQEIQIAWGVMTMRDIYRPAPNEPLQFLELIVAIVDDGYAQKEYLEVV